tara:strand:- start:166 stop:480 length:315 start_codon:yes stop_codon:yes gene_type:complete
MKRIFNTNNPLSMMLMFIVPVGATFITTMIIFFIVSLVINMQATEMYSTNVGFCITVIMYLFQQIQTAEWIEEKKRINIERRSEQVERINNYKESTKNPIYPTK